MNNLTVFENPEFGAVRTVELDGTPWLVGKDVAEALGYTNPQKAIRDHVDEEDRTVNESFTVNGTPITLINESDLYSLVLSSKLPTARKFKRWVTSEVLPSIRRTGQYSSKTSNADLRLKIMAMNARSRAASQMTRLWTAAGVKLADQALALNGYFDGLALPREAFGEVCVHLLDATAIAAHLGILSAIGKPHNQAVAALIGTLTLEEGECALTPYSKGGHDGVSAQYTASVEDKVRAWLDANGWPEIIAAGGKRYGVVYQIH